MGSQFIPFGKVLNYVFNTDELKNDDTAGNTVLMNILLNKTTEDSLIKLLLKVPNAIDTSIKNNIDENIIDVLDRIIENQKEHSRIKYKYNVQNIREFIVKQSTSEFVD